MYLEIDLQNANGRRREGRPTRNVTLDGVINEATRIIKLLRAVEGQIAIYASEAGRFIGYVIVDDEPYFEDDEDKCSLTYRFN